MTCLRHIWFEIDVIVLHAHFQDMQSFKLQLITHNVPHPNRFIVELIFMNLHPADSHHTITPPPSPWSGRHLFLSISVRGKGGESLAPNILIFDTPIRIRRMVFPIFALGLHWKEGITHPSPGLLTGTFSLHWPQKEQTSYLSPILFPSQISGSISRYWVVTPSPISSPIFCPEFRMPKLRVLRRLLFPDPVQPRPQLGLVLATSSHSRVKPVCSDEICFGFYSRLKNG